MAKTQILEYTIHLTDQAQVDAYNAQLAAGTGPGQLLFYWSPVAQAMVYGVLRAPETGAAIEFSAPFQLDTEPFLAPCTRSPWFTDGANFPTNVATFTRKSGGWFGIPILFGSTTRFYWVGRFVFAPPSVETPGEPPSEPPPPLMARRWIDGFEMPIVGSVQTGEGGSAGAAEVFRDASRVTCDGLGYGSRNRSTSLRSHTVMENRGGVASDKKTGWDRFYFRVRRFPTDEADVWFGFDNASNGVKLRVATDGRLLVYKWVNNAATLIGTGPIIDLNRWYKFDCVIGFRGVTPDWASDTPVGNGPGNLYVPGQCVVRSANNYVCILNTSTPCCPPMFTQDNDPLNNSGFPHWELFSNTAGKLGSFRLYINNEQAIDLDGYSQTAGTDATPNFHTESRIGPAQSSNTAEFDYDSWIGVDCPEVQRAWNVGSFAGGVVSPDLDDYPDYDTLETQLDFIAGTHVQLVRPNASSVITNWTGNWQSLMKRLVDQIDTNNRLTSSTTGQLLELLADVSPTYLLDGATGIGAVGVGCYYNRSAGVVGDDTIGGALSLDDDADGLEDSAPTFSRTVTPPASGAPGWRSALYDADGLVVAPKLLSLKLRYTHGADAIQRQVESLHAVVELIGIFGPEDLPAGSEDTRAFPPPDPHFANQPFSPWARTSGPRFGTAVIIAGSYVGTGAPFDLEFPLPPCFLWIRRISGTNTQMSSFRWFVSMLCGNLQHGQEPISPWVIGEHARDNAFPPAAAEDDQEVQWLARILTADDKVNASGVTYAYTAICDPAARYVRCGTSFHESGYPYTEDLADPQFTPIAGFFYPEDRGGTSTVTMAYKGPGHTARTGHTLNGTALTELASFAQGQVVIGADTTPAGADSCPYILFRLNDGNGEAPIFQHATYTGDGVSPRTINLTPAFGVRPVFGVVIGDNASVGDQMRDTEHNGTESTDMGSGSITAANGIRGGGIDQIIVGSQLNASGVVYHVFVLPGDATAGEGGWGVAGEYYVSEPDSALDVGQEDPEEVDPAPGDSGEGDGETQIPPDLDDDLADAACVEPTTRMVNQALQRIGINIPIITLATEQSAEAAAVRLVYDFTLQETLRRMPWPFATRYATLVKTAGTASVPANVEWQYAYQLPDRCIFPRRLAADRGDAVDPTPPPFREAGGLIMTNQDAASLEFTARVACPANVGDATFRNAWCWRLAAELAPPLTRMPERQQFCLEMFEQSISVAEKVLRLGNPGLRPAVNGADLDALTLDDKLRAINVALMRIGARTIADIATEQSREVLSALLVYEDELRSTLRDFPWPFATRYATLTLVDGTEDDPATPDHLYSYRWPDESIFARRIVKPRTLGGGTRKFDPAPVTFIIGSDDTGLLILTDWEDAILEYTIRPSNIWTVADAQFKDAFEWRLAAALAPTLALPDPEREEQYGQSPKAEVRDPRQTEGGRTRLQQMRMERARWAWAMYERALEIAKGSAGNEVQREKDGDASWILDRN